jgi:hypothetical protein
MVNIIRDGTKVVSLWGINIVCVFEMKSYGNNNSNESYFTVFDAIN